MAYTKFSIAVLTSVTIFSSLLYQRFCMSKPIPIIQSGTTLGISLSADHGVVSVREQDGTFRDVGKVKGDVVYLGLMKRLSLPTSERSWCVYPTNLHDKN
jgi:hypothetical protein